MTREVAIIGAGMTRFGELWSESLRTIAIEAGFRALEDASIDGDRIQALYMGNQSAGTYVHQEHVAALIADASGLSQNGIPAVRIEAADASGGMALHQGYLAVASGHYDLVVVGGVEKMTDIDDAELARIAAQNIDQEWESIFGATLPGLFAMMARLYLDRYEVTREQLAEIPVKAHRHGVNNPLAQFQREISVEQVLAAPPVAEPLTRFDCAPQTDGGAAVVLMSAEKATSYASDPILIKGTAVASDTLSLHDRADPLRLLATKRASDLAYASAGIGPADLQVAEVHDSFSIAEVLALEELGLAPTGQAAKLCTEGDFTYGGRVVVNPSGGLKARGHPMGASGVAQAVEGVLQLRGDAGARNVPGTEHVLLHSMGGTGATAVVTILGRSG